MSVAPHRPQNLNPSGFMNAHEGHGLGSPAWAWGAVGDDGLGGAPGGGPTIGGAPTGVLGGCDAPGCPGAGTPRAGGAAGIAWDGGREVAAGSLVPQARQNL
jgi:hypothetical protein